MSVSSRKLSAVSFQRSAKNKKGKKFSPQRTRRKDFCRFSWRLGGLAVQMSFFWLTAES
jgi:hypothetical protein